MGKYDHERPGKSRKIKNPKFRNHYDESYSDEDLDDFFHRKKKGKKKRQRDRNPEDSWEEKY